MLEVLYLTLCYTCLSLKSLWFRTIIEIVAERPKYSVMILKHDTYHSVF